MDLADIWPPFGLTIRTGDLEMTPVRETDYPELAETAGAGVRPDGVFAFLVDWDTGSAEQVARSLAQYHWRTRGEFSTEGWTIEFAVRAQGRIIGVQGVSSTSFPRTRSVSTGSWLARSEHGKGYGTRMRAALVTAFADHFGAETFHTGYFIGNDASRRVSEKVGYRPNGEHTIIAQDGNAHLEYRAVLSADKIVRPPDPVEVTGAEAVRRFLGID